MPPRWIDPWSYGGGVVSGGHASCDEKMALGRWLGRAPILNGDVCPHITLPRFFIDFFIPATSG